MEGSCQLSTPTALASRKNIRYPVVRVGTREDLDAMEEKINIPFSGVEF
jgi:hypothetical protein